MGCHCLVREWTDEEDCSFDLGGLRRWEMHEWLRGALGSLEVIQGGGPLSWILKEA